jgi:hypothetical protein
MFNYYMSVGRGGGGGQFNPDAQTYSMYLFGGNPAERGRGSTTGRGSHVKHDLHMTVL